MTDFPLDTNGKKLEEGFYIRTDRSGSPSFQSFIYLSGEHPEFRQQHLLRDVNSPLVSLNTSFEKIPQDKLDNLRNLLNQNTHHIYCPSN
jgi:hypothetical protein|tara:strand:+ start:725 stop:994 length:270 start_codon:yes stop_codon:yes gene_type:complete